MITFSRIGQMGRLGNSLFQIASMTGIAERIGTTAHFPQWRYKRYFKNQLKRMSKKRGELHEPSFHYDNTWFQDERDYIGWLQSDKYFSKEIAKNLFEFEPTFKHLVRTKHSKKFEKETICISIRRGDFVGNENYEQIPIKYYIGALLKLDYKNCNILFFSDDISYCKTHFECLENAYFIDEDAIEQLCLMSMCENHIISSSTFSWWGAYLSESKRVIRPNYNFSESYLKKYSDKDYYCEDWEVFDHKDYKIPLDASFLIPVQYDHSDRLENFKLTTEFLKDFDCEVLVGENNGDKFGTKIHFEGKFHRTKMLNALARKASKGIIVLFDADVIIPPMQLFLACEATKNGFDVVYPYDGRFARVPRKWYQTIFKHLDIGILSSHTFEGMRGHDLMSVGGAIVFNKKSYFEGGGENENFVSYAPEDKEIFERFTRLGYSIKRVKGALYHLDHFIGLDSYIHHEDYQANEAEYHKVKNMTKDDLRKYALRSPL